MKHTHPCHHCLQPFDFNTDDVLMTAHSCIIVLQVVDTNGYMFYQCDGGQKTDGHTWQHWHCSHEHMLQGVKKCINEHYHEHLLQSPAPGNVVNLHKTVLTHNTPLECKVCSAPLVAQAYRFTISMATPIPYFHEESSNEIGAWCCSLAHARAYTIKLIEGLKQIDPDSLVYSEVVDIPTYE